MGIRLGKLSSALERFNGILSRVNLRIRKIHNNSEILMVLDYFMNPTLTQESLERVGPEGDGGYYLPASYDQIRGFVSPGVGDLIGFDMHLLGLGMKGVLCDGTIDPKSVTPHPNMVFINKNIGLKKGQVTLEEIVNSEFNSIDELILQMDIEGDEFLILAHTEAETMKKFKIISLELHSLFRMLDQWQLQNLFIPMHKLLSENYNVISCHTNLIGKHFWFNGRKVPNIIEVTLLRKT
jgi:hypothetical protein